MRHVVLLLLGAHLVSAGKHSLRYFFSAVSGINDFPEFTIVGQVDDQQFMYFDSKIMKVVPKTAWMRQSVGADYWDRETQIGIGTHQAYKNNIQVLKERFNQTTGVHTVQVMYGCEFDDQTGETNGFRQEGYDGEDFLLLDLTEMRWITPVMQGFFTVQKWNNYRYEIEAKKHYFSTVCIEWLKKYLEYGKSSLKKTVSPQVSLLQKSSSSPVVCHATGFYPKYVTISWMRNGQDHDEDVDLGELLPNEDGTFQRSSELRVTPEEWKNNKFICVVEHQGKTITANEIKTNQEHPQTADGNEEAEVSTQDALTLAVKDVAAGLREINQSLNKLIALLGSNRSA
ncbi:major histocompatibility complex class I-related gene protein-like isoform X4 [Carassius carassius]|uniref:major histocompatibility complex class I-related gene protein-like isoform X4 n=1 Tax=Carassius carassius TaxID=217509 RepID=UPI002868D095|nr:major histocompatibility complex class I-related gene protein-like isoform X4 [Carassius carassius]